MLLLFSSRKIIPPISLSLSPPSQLFFISFFVLFVRLSSPSKSLAGSTPASLYDLTFFFFCLFVNTHSPFENLSTVGDVVKNVLSFPSLFRPLISLLSFTLYSPRGTWTLNCRGTISESIRTPSAGPSIPK